jgi:hypothetical protein
MNAQHHGREFSYARSPSRYLCSRPFTRAKSNGAPSGPVVASAWDQANGPFDFSDSERLFLGTSSSRALI